MPAGDRIRRAADRHLFAANQDLAGVDLVGAEHGARHFGAARAHQPGKAEDLALAHHEAHVLDDAPAVQVAHLEHDLVVRGRAQPRSSLSNRVRPTIMPMMVSMLVVAVGTVAMYWPSRITVTRSEILFSSSILCEM